MVFPPPPSRHPDHNPGCGDECREKMRTIQQAYKAVSENPEAVPEKEEDGGFNATLLHLFLGRLFEMVCPGVWRGGRVRNPFFGVLFSRLEKSQFFCGFLPLSFALAFG